MKYIKNLFLRGRLWRISKRLGIRLCPWQRDYALGLTDRLECPPGPSMGKTTAVMLRLLLLRDSPGFVPLCTAHGCSRFHCDKHGDRYCCADCVERKRDRCRNPCLNDPSRCGLEDRNAT